jgi:large conductance mechanosensitive channel
MGGTVFPRMLGKVFVSFFAIWQHISPFQLIKANSSHSCNLFLSVKLLDMKGFIEFVREQGVMGLAVGFILGGAISKLVSSIVNDLINPVLGIILGAAGNLGEAYFQIGSSRILWGHFLATLIDFVVIAAVVYFGVKGLRLDRLDKKKK